MEFDTALKAFAALSQATRLNVFKVLREYGEAGVAAGEISTRLAIPKNTLSFHLSHLSHADLVTSSRQGRSIIYRAKGESITHLLAFLYEHCHMAEADSKT